MGLGILGGLWFVLLGPDCGLPGDPASVVMVYECVSVRVRHFVVTRYLEPTPFLLKKIREEELVACKIVLVVLGYTSNIKCATACHFCARCFGMRFV